MKVIKTAESATKESRRKRKLCALTTIDVKNAFNSLPWNTIAEALYGKTISDYMLNLLLNYLGERSLVYQGTTNSLHHVVEAGVPQGSILGPTLWNIAYDGVLELERPKGAEFIGYADDLGVLTIANTEDTLEEVTNGALQVVVDWMEEAGLTITPQKTGGRSI